MKCHYQSKNGALPRKIAAPSPFLWICGTVSSIVPTLFCSRSAVPSFLGFLSADAHLFNAFFDGL